MARSARSAIRAIISTVSTGNRPVAVSAESMIASAPSKMAVATSLTSARVGRRWSTMDSSIWVATITGALLAEELADLLDVGGRAHERHRDVVHAVRDAEAQVIPVLGGERRAGQRQ